MAQTADATLEAISDLIGKPRYPAVADFPAEMGYGWNTLAATENGNPLHWDPGVSEALTAGPILPLSTLSIWMRPHRWSPGATGEQKALQAHFDLKEALGLPEAIMSDNACEFHEPVRPGDVIGHHQVLRSISEPKTTRLGTGRFWVIDVEYHNQQGALVGVESYTGFGYSRPHGARSAAETAPAGPSASRPANGSQAGAPPSTVADAETPPEGGWAKADPTHDQVPVGARPAPLVHDVTATTVVLGALASRDWRPMHHDYRFATERNGTRDIFLNTPNQAAWFERAVTDWTGPKGRIGRMRFRMRDSVFPGDRMTITSKVTGTQLDNTGCGWVDLDLTLRVGAEVRSTCQTRVAIPTSGTDNPWSRTAERWRPPPW